MLSSRNKAEPQSSFLQNISVVIYWLTLLLLAIYLLQPDSQATILSGLSLLKDIFVSLISYDPDILSAMSLNPLFVLLAVSIIILSLFKSDNRPARLIVSLMMVILAGRYLLWRTMFTLNLEDPLNAPVSLLFLLAEAVLLVYTVVGIFILQVNLTDRTREADVREKRANLSAYYPSVDIFIASYNEPASLLRRTITGCQNVDYKNKNIYLLDDGRRPEIQALCEALGCHYIRREDNKHYKAGNLNNALSHTQGEFILFLDADFVPYKNIILRIRGLFQNGKIDLVQTPQHFNNSDAIAHNLGLSGRLTNEQDIFFRNGQPSRDSANAVICHGTCFMARRNSLKKIGGIPTETLSEDFLTSLKLQMNDGKVIYLNEVLSAGFVPDNVGDYLTQRLRWARGTIQVLFSSLNPLTSEKLNLMQKTHHLMGFWYWFSFIGVGFLFSLPLGYLFLDLQPLKGSMNGILFYMLPLYAASILFTNWINNGRRSFFWSTVYDLVIAFPIAMTVINSLIQPFSSGFKVTPKDVNSDKASLNASLATPLILVLALYGVGFVYKFFIQNAFDTASSSDYVILFWLAYNAVILWMGIMACIDAPQRRQHVRFKFNERHSVLVGEAKSPASLVNMSETGICLEISTEHPLRQTLQAGREVKLYIPGMDLALNSTIIRLNSNEEAQNLSCHLKFLDISQEQYRQMVMFLFNGPTNKQEELVRKEYYYFSDFIRSIFRVYPLINSAK